MEQLYLKFVIDELTWSDIADIVKIHNEEHSRLLFEAMHLYKNEKYADAIFILEESAKLGNSYAMNLLGYIYIFVSDLKDKTTIEKGMKYLQQAAELHNSYAMNNLGLMFMEGTKVPKDISKGLELLKASVDLGNALAKKNLGLYYIKYGIDKKLGRELLDEASKMGVSTTFEFKAAGWKAFTILSIGIFCLLAGVVHIGTSIYRLF